MMNDPASAATLYVLSQLRNSGIKPATSDFESMCRELPFLSKRSYQEFCEKIKPLDRGFYVPLSLETGFDPIQTQIQISRYLAEPDVPASSSTITVKPKPEVSVSPQPPMSSASSPHTGTTDNYSSALLRIHVVDEAKRRSQDFFCAKWLLVSKMKFFAAHLTDDSKPDDVDISVQCDVVIFDWLMKYVHKDVAESQQSGIGPSGAGGPGPPVLEAANVISILISSDFLQMDDLVTDCLNFIHTNTESVVNNSPANFNCISEIVLKRLAALFDIEELDALKDKKDRLKSRLYQAKIESMFTRTSQYQLLPDSANKDHLAQLILDDIDIPDASTMFQCKVCQKLLTTSTHLLIPCESSQLQLTRWGEIVANHVPMDTFDVNEYCSSQFKELKSWRVVFWRLWGTIQCLRCVRCRQWFRCVDFSSCWNHPEKPASDYYPCCRQPFRPFDPFSVRTGGCRVMDHLTDFQVGGDRTKRIYELLLRFRDPIVGEQAQANAQASSQPLALDPVVFIRSFMQPAEEPGKPQPLTAFASPRSSNTPIQTGLSVNFDFSRFLMPTWNLDLSTRLNQDNQRQADYRIMREMCEYIVMRKATAGVLVSSVNSGRGTAPSTTLESGGVPVVQASTASTSMPRDVPGGFYARIESQLRSKVQALLAPSSRSGPRLTGQTPNSRQRPSSLLK